MINLITRQINQPQISRANQSNSSPRLNNLRQLSNDVFTPSFKGGEKFQMPLEKIEEIGQKYIGEFAQKTEGMEKYKKVVEFVEEVRDSINKTRDSFIERKKITNKDFNEESFKKFVTDCSHESTGSYIAPSMTKLLVPDETLSIEARQFNANEDFKDIVNHINETTRRYQFFIDHNMDSDTGTIGADKVFKLLIDAFKEQADNKNIKLVVRGEDILKKNAQSTYSDYKNYIIMSNFLGNAIKYSDPDSVIELGFRTIKNDEHLYFFIKDQGIGVLEEDMVNIFNQQRGKNVGDRAGSGYGLYRTASLVQDAGGKIKPTSPLYPDEPIHRGTMFECPVFSNINQKFPLTKTD